MFRTMNAYVKFNAQKRIEAGKKKDKDGRVLCKSLNNAVYSKTMANLRNRIDVKLLSNEKDYLNWTSKPSHISHKNLTII